MMKRFILVLGLVFGFSNLFAKPFDFVGKYEQGLYEVSYYESYEEGTYFLTFEDTSEAEDFLNLLQLTFPYYSQIRYESVNNASIELRYFLENHEIVFIRTSKAFSAMGLYDENIIVTIDYYFGE